MIVGGRYRQLLATSPDHFPTLMTEELQNLSHLPPVYIYIARMSRSSQNVTLPYTQPRDGCSSSSEHSYLDAVIASTPDPRSRLNTCERHLRCARESSSCLRQGVGRSTQDTCRKYSPVGASIASNAKTFCTTVRPESGTLQALARGTAVWWL